MDLTTAAELFVCPRCKGGLAAAAHVLRCAACRLAYPVVDGIPDLLIDEAMPMASGDVNSDSEWPSRR
ncbi:MAG: Trm112 family protein [Candidatus Dormibacter sp.]